MPTSESPTVVFLHAHPDDETLLTGGTIAKLARDGVRVVVITATDGAAGLASDDAMAGQNLRDVRSEELKIATKILGVDQVIALGYADSGLDGAGSSSIDGVSADGATPFAQVPLYEVTERVASLVAEIQPNFIVGYDPSGGYGHPDHVRVSELGRAVAQRTGVKLYEASLPREPYAQVAGIVTKLGRLVPPLAKLDLSSWENAYLPKADLAVRVDARSEAMIKRAALKAHASQGTGGLRTVTILRAMPVDLFRKLYGIEWYAEPVLDESGNWQYQAPAADTPTPTAASRTPDGSAPTAPTRTAPAASFAELASAPNQGGKT